MGTMDHRIHAEEKRVHQCRGQALRRSVQHGSDLLAYCKKPNSLELVGFLPNLASLFDPASILVALLQERQNSQQVVSRLQFPDWLPDSLATHLERYLLAQFRQIRLVLFRELRYHNPVCYEKRDHFLSVYVAEASHHLPARD